MVFLCDTFVGGNNGYILITANGGMNQQRVAVSNTSDQLQAFMIAPLPLCPIILHPLLASETLSSLPFELFQTLFCLKAGLQCCRYCTVIEFNSCYS